MILYNYSNLSRYKKKRGVFMKRRITVFSIVFSVLAAMSVQASDISVSIDGITLETDVPAAIVEGRTLVPMRSIFEALDAKVEWDADSKSITASKDGRTVKMQINSKQYSVDGKNLTLDVPPMITDGRTLVPARAVSESLDCQVEWDAEAKAVKITTGSAKVPAKTENASSEDWKAYFMEEDMTPAPIANAKLNEAQAAMHEAGRYNFEQTVMPQALFNDDGTLADLIQNDPQKFADEVYNTWETAVDQVILDYMINSEEEYVISSEEDLERNFKLFQSNCYLYGSDNMGLSMTKDAEKFYTLLELAPDDYFASCRYIMITYSKADGFGYYTMETSLDGMYALCRVTPTGRGNSGVFEGIGKQDFLDYVEQSPALTTTLTKN